MVGYGHLKHARNRKIQPHISERLTIGRVIDTNDPQQMGRVRAFCPGFGDTQESLVRDIPWAMYVSPFGGIVNTGKRGTEESPIDGPVAYGMWNIPKVGSYVLVGCIDGDTTMRFFAGSIQPQYMTHTMPHGRYLWGDLEDGNPAGPLDTFEQPIEPTHTNFTKHFGDRENMEWKTRGADMQVSGITNVAVEHEYDAPGSFKADHEWGVPNHVTDENGDQRTVKGVGYGLDQQRPDDNYPDTGGYNYDSLIYSWTTPGFHSISMDDRHQNARIRIRTTSGHQIIMDDTNERIYINTAGGESWIELDSVGNIDIFASKNISTHAGGDINFTTDKTFRVQAKEGVHIRTDDEMRLHSDLDFHIRTEQNFRTHSKLETRIESDADMHILSDNTNAGQGNLFVEFASNIHIISHGNSLWLSDNNIDIKSGSATLIQQGSTLDIATGSVGKWSTGSDAHINSGGTAFVSAASAAHINSGGGVLNLQSGGNMNLNAGGQLIQSGSQIHLNGPSAAGATSASSASSATDATEATPAEELHSYWTSRVPEHEPWARVFMTEDADKDGTTMDVANQHITEYDYTSQDVGKNTTRGDAVYGPYNRGPHWRR